MTVVINKIACPMCGQSVNEREISLYSGMVKALVRVWFWCKENKRNEFTRKEIKHLFKGVDNEIARWGDWVFFGGLVYKPFGKKGFWGLNMDRCKEFIGGKKEIPTKAYKNPLKKEIVYRDYRFIGNVSHLKEFLDESKDYIARYF